MLDVQKFSYHCHTNFSDGRDSLLSMVRRAKILGWSEIGITDHLIVHKNMLQSPSAELMFARPASYIYHHDFATIRDDFARHCDELHQLSRQEGIKIYAGFEVDFFTYDGWLEELRDFLTHIDYDYLISGNHFLFGADGETLVNMTDLRQVYPDAAQYDELLCAHFQAMADSAASGLFKFVAHLDYVKRVGVDICGAEHYKAQKQAVLAALQKHNIGTEISTKGLRKSGEFYPCDWQLKEIAARQIPVVISDDAHCTEELGDHFDLAEQALAQYGITRRLHF